MGSFGWGVGFGVAAVVIVLGAAAASYAMAPTRLADAIPPGHVAVGHFLVTTEDGAYVGTLVYAPGVLASDALRSDLASYRLTEQQATPVDAPPAVCGQVACTSRAVGGSEALLGDVQNATRGLVDDLGLSVLQNVSTSMSDRRDGSLVILSLAHVDDALPRLGEPLPRAPPEAKLGDLRGELEKACGLADPVEGAAPCAERYLRFSIVADWDWVRPIRTGNDQPGVSVLGPLAWSSGDGTLTEVASLAGAAPTARLFVPSWALTGVTLGILLAIALQEWVERTESNAFVPLPPLAVVLGVTLLWLVDKDPRTSWATFLAAFFALFLAWFTLIRLLDGAGVQYFSTFSTLAALAVGAATLLARLDDPLLRVPERLVVALQENATPSLARDILRDALVGMAAVSLVMLGIHLAAAYAARKEAKERLTPDERKALRDATPQDAARLLRQHERRLSRIGYASLVADTYARLRRRNRDVWLDDAMLKPYLRAPPETEDSAAMMTLWRMHLGASKRGRRLRDLGLREPADESSSG